MITPERIRELFAYDPSTGLFTYAQMRRGMHKSYLGKVACRLNSEGYVFLQIDGRQYLGHRLAWLYFYGSHPAYEIDHIEGVS